MPLHKTLPSIHVSLFNTYVRQTIYNYTVKLDFFILDFFIIEFCPKWQLAEEFFKY